ncbi:hypothetical protein SUGI_0557240 [Cryptomeria japonica]|nr:hypothetical protein SUGI_0557240 [Cryptomeria japonica]
MVRHKGVPSFWTGSDLTVQRAMTGIASQKSILSHYLMLDELDTHLTTSCGVELVNVANEPPGVTRSCMKAQLKSKVASNTEKEISPAPEVPMAALKTKELKLVITDLQKRRWGTTSTLNHSEVRGGGKKPYKQKGSEKVRHGLQKTPLRSGGGVIFGPNIKDWSIKINKKKKCLAISTTLSSAAINNVVIDSFNEKCDTPQTNNFVVALKNLGVEPSEHHALIFTTELSKNVRCLRIDGDVPDLPMEFEKHERLTYYDGPLTQGMSLYEFPPSLRIAYIRDYSEKRVAYSKFPPKVTPVSSLVILSLYGFKNMQRLPDGVEKLTKLEELFLWGIN